jgi:hypothetical protein
MNEDQSRNNILSFERDQLRRESAAVHADAVLILREPPQDDDQPMRALIAFDRRDPSADLDRSKKEATEYLARCLRGGMYYPHLYGIGATMLARFDLEKSRHWTAEVLGLDRADDAMTNALMSALLSTIATSPSPVDIDTALFGIGSFVHAHPRFARILGHRRYEPPFREHTEYTVCNL